jgi:hypothetical protein
MSKKPSKKIDPILKKQRLHKLSKFRGMLKVSHDFDYKIALSDAINEKYKS